MDVSRLIKTARNTGSFYSLSSMMTKIVTPYIVKNRSFELKRKYRKLST